jgi:hypothetical protein
MPIAHAPRSHIFKVATFSVFVLFVFNGFMVALACAPVVVPITLFESLRSGYFVLVGFVAALAVSIALGLPFGLVFPRSTMNWSLLCSVLVAGIILFLSAFGTSEQSSDISWVRYSDVSQFVLMFTLTACGAARVRRVYGI